MKEDESRKKLWARAAKVFARSFLIGGSWNYSKLQNLGFLYSLLPAADSRGKDLKGILSRHKETFSTHPVMATLILGSVLKCEELEGGKSAAHLKESLAGPYAALGDPFFSGSLRPLCSILAVGAAFLQGGIIAPLLVLLVYNAVHGYIRFRGFVEAYRDGSGGVKFLADFSMPEKGRVLQALSLILLAFLAGNVLTFSIIQGRSPAADLVGVLVVLAACLICLALIKKRVPVLVILYGASAVMFLAA